MMRIHRGAAAMAVVGRAGEALTRAAHTEKSALSAATREGLIQEAVPGTKNDSLPYAGTTRMSPP
jgi:aldehyde:ferredoxin oxidoreductase